MTQLNIRFDEQERKYYVYFNNQFAGCGFQSDPFDTLEEAELFKEQEEKSADYSACEEEDESH